VESAVRALGAALALQTAIDEEISSYGRAIGCFW